MEGREYSLWEHCDFQSTSVNANCVSLQKVFLIPEGAVFCPCLSLSCNCQQERDLIFFFLKIVIKREDVASCCELQTCCLVLLQLPRCLETIMALQHLPLFDMLFNPQLLRAFGRNKHRRRNKASLQPHNTMVCHIRSMKSQQGKGCDSLCKGPKTRTCSCTSQEHSAA